MRFHFQVTDREKSVSPFVVQVIALGSYDAYWDGRYIGSSGKVAGTKDLEVPGYHHLTLSIGDTISKPGHHVLALRISNFHHQRKYTFFNVHAGTYEDLNRMPQLMLVLMSMLGGIFLIGAIYYLFLYRAHLSEPLFLVFAILCLLFLVLLAAEYMPATSNYAYPFQFIRLEAIGILTLVISILIPYFLNRQFGTFGPYLFNSGYILILLTAFIFYHGRYDLSAKVLGLLTGIACLVVVLRAAQLRIQGYLGVLAALSASLMTAFFLSFDYSLYISFGLLLVSMLYLLSKRSEKMMGDIQQNMLLSERLKTELLKKSIQPHFLMNSLTALTELVEQSPNEGISMITALAGEFELLSEMAEKKLVPIEDEIALCNFHLDIMRYRKDINYLFTVEGIDPTESIPPAIIHTALENGVTHSRPLEDGTVRLHLCYSSGHTARSYTLRVRANNSRLKAQGTGTGFKYIRARLNESYGNNWHFESHAVEDGWVTKVTINR
ncbi:histidine kinase [Pedobacter sp. 22163]|uniref:histidine kinase n=1 Tax=Pedobacter sp. 22163 TaxID=3453883 RepID=UPI003F837B8D